MKLHVGDKAPEFSLKDQNGKIHSLLDYKGKWVLLYFYPQDDTPGCTTEACSFRDNLPRFPETDFVVLGISTDTIESHKKFADKYGLPFTLLSDEEKQVVKLYDVWQIKKFTGKEYLGTVRTSFLIDSQGNIAKIYEKVKPETHVQEVLKDLHSYYNTPMHI